MSITLTFIIYVITNRRSDMLCNYRMSGYGYTLRNEGSLAALKEPLGFFCETGGSFDGLGFFCIRKGSLMYTTGPEGSLASSPHRGFFECNTMADICLSASVCMTFFNEHNSSCMSYFWYIIKLIVHTFICNMLLNTFNIWKSTLTYIRLLSLITAIEIWNCYMVISSFM